MRTKEKDRTTKSQNEETTGKTINQSYILTRPLYKIIAILRGTAFNPVNYKISRPVEILSLANVSIILPLSSSQIIFLIDTDRIELSHR